MSRMSGKTLRILLSTAVIVGALGVLISLTVQQNAAYYLHVDEVMANPQQWYGKPLQLHGFVVDGSILQRKDSLDYRFDIKNGASVVKASYTGVVPDTFKDGSEVVLKGKLGPDGFHVQKDGVMAKCPSRYEAKGQ